MTAHVASVTAILNNRRNQFHVRHATFYSIRPVLMYPMPSTSYFAKMTQGYSGSAEAVGGLHQRCYNT